MAVNALNISREDQAAKIAAEIRARIDGPKQGNQAENVNSGGGLFDAALDAVNPLQHIPGVSSVYRAASGDEINPLASMAGGFLFGGPIGLGVGAASSFIEILTGKSPAEHAMALLEGLSDDKNTNIAANKPDGPPDSPPDSPMGTDALVGSVDHRAEDDANVLSDAGAAHRPGFGAAKDTVEYSSNIWTQTAIMGVTDKYDSANRQNDGNARQRNTPGGGTGKTV